MTRKVKWLLFTMLVLAGAALADRAPSFIKATHLGPREVLVTCKEDAHPKVDVTNADFVVVSCPAP